MHAHTSKQHVGRKFLQFIELTDNIGKTFVVLLNQNEKLFLLTKNSRSTILAAKFQKNVGKTFAVYRKSTKIAKFFSLESFFVYDM